MVIIPLFSLRNSCNEYTISCLELLFRINSSYSQENLAKVDSLTFESRFECGNLRKAIQVRFFYIFDLV